MLSKSSYLCKYKTVEIVITTFPAFYLKANSDKFSQYGVAISTKIME